MQPDDGTYKWRWSWKAARELLELRPPYSSGYSATPWLVAYSMRSSHRAASALAFTPLREARKAKRAAPSYALGLLHGAAAAAALAALALAVAARRR